jgi:hypothetical protein
MSARSRVSGHESIEGVSGTITERRKGTGNRSGNIAKRDRAVEETGDRHLVRGVEDRRRRPTLPPGGDPQPEGWEGVVAHGLVRQR